MAAVPIGAGYIADLGRVCGVVIRHDGLLLLCAAIKVALVVREWTSGGHEIVLVVYAGI